MENEDYLELGGKKFTSRYILGSGKYSEELIDAAVNSAKAEMITVAIRYSEKAAGILKHIPEGVTILPNTSGCVTVEEAVNTAHIAREMGCGNFIKLEIILIASICCQTMKLLCKQQRFWLTKALLFFLTCIQICTLLRQCATLELLQLCLSAL